MQPQVNSLLLRSALILSVLSLLAFIVNFSIFRYQGNNYFPAEMPIIALILCFSLWGCYLLFDRKHITSQIIRELVYYFLVIALLAFATNAVQYTPFSPIDKKLIAIDYYLSINLQKIMAWTANIHWLRTILAISYDSLPFQMCYLPLMVIIMRQYELVREYYALLLLTALIGFSFYYFFPTLGPASFLKSPYFMQEQYATGIKFIEIHEHKLITTMHGGMIAMPSFHTIWACLCLFLVRKLMLIFIILLPINVLLIAACVMLGWHYFIDLIGSLVVLLLAYAIYLYRYKPSFV